MPIDHDALVRPEVTWSNHRLFEFSKWWVTVYRDEVSRRGLTNTQLFRHILGRQAETIMFRHRNWVWQNVDEGWVLYVHKRGPQICVATGMTADESWATFEKFRDRVDTWFKDNPHVAP